MHNEFTAIIEQDEDWFIAYCPEIPGANGQGRTIEECRKSLAEAIELILEDRREDGFRGVPADAIRETVVLLSAEPGGSMRACGNGYAGDLQAILRGDRIEWDDDVPEQIRTQAALTVFVTIPDQPVAADDSRGLRMAEALERLAANGGVGSITDPVQWQRERRQDRDLPGRS